MVARLTAGAPCLLVPAGARRGWRLTRFMAQCRNMAAHGSSLKDCTSATVSMVTRWPPFALRRPVHRVE
ncbi:TPA: hypothetical protein I8Y21_006356 [Klebsiella oxytoca]|uniref:Uncharacterized protein n=1 Tax=Klebsiella oxytoca TaxID=571 RepID=A0AAN5LEF3_KLEOX|nr:hypothetical protein [Klebsiella oxytoca]